MKVNFFTFALLFLSTATFADVTAIYPNPHLTDPSLATTFVSKLRAMNIKQMDSLIRGECNQFKDYVSLSVQNWSQYKSGRKSLDETANYSQQLISEIPYNQSLQYTFPLGSELYFNSEKHIKSQVLSGRAEKDLKDEMFDACLNVNNSKYFNLLSSPKYSVGNQAIFISEEELQEKFNPNRSLIKQLSYVPSKVDKLTPRGIHKDLSISNKELHLAHGLIDQDIKNSFLSSDIRWLDYKNASRETQKDFDKFVKEGGRNKTFAQVIFSLKIMSSATKNFENLYIWNLDKASENIKQNGGIPIDDHSRFSPIARKLNYSIAELKK